MKKLPLYFLMLIVVGTLLLVNYFGPWDTGSKNGPTIHVYVKAEEKTMKMPLEDYLVGVLAEEMPAKFEKEALKAQAIAARTYTLKKMKSFENSGNQVHPKAEICTDVNHCQGWLTKKQMQDKWGWVKYWEYEKRLRTAVRETTGKVVLFQKELIDPVYHSTCGGHTENAEEVWTYSIPYLKGVACEWDQEAPKFESSLFVSFSEFNKKLGLKVPSNGISQKTLRVLSKTKTGRLKTVRIENKVLLATELRRMLSLNSTNFVWEVTDQGIAFKVRGYGHGVGLCQYGANGLAKKGYSAEKIIKYYYSGVNVEKIY